jgi:hypothetical protein
LISEQKVNKSTPRCWIDLPETHSDPNGPDGPPLTHALIGGAPARSWLVDPIALRYKEKVGASGTSDEVYYSVAAPPIIPNPSRSSGSAVAAERLIAAIIDAATSSPHSTAMPGQSRWRPEGHRDQQRAATTSSVTATRDDGRFLCCSRDAKPRWYDHQCPSPFSLSLSLLDLIYQYSC